jgi:hypothetical protein
MIKDKSMVAVYYVSVHSRTMVFWLKDSKTSCPLIVNSSRALAWTWVYECTGIAILEEEQTLIGVGRESGKKGEGLGLSS